MGINIIIKYVFCYILHDKDGVLLQIFVHIKYYMF